MYFVPARWRWRSLKCCRTRILTFGQLVLMRNILYSFFAYKTHGKKAAYNEKDLSKAAIAQVEEFYGRSWFFPYLLKFPGSQALLTCAFLSLLCSLVSLV